LYYSTHRTTKLEVLTVTILEAKVPYSGNTIPPATTPIITVSAIGLAGPGKGTGQRAPAMVGGGLITVGGQGTGAAVIGTILIRVIAYGGVGPTITGGERSWGRRSNTRTDGLPRITCCVVWIYM